jgi:hypothetical protein
MLKPEAGDRIRKALVHSGLLYKYEKFIFQSLYYALRKDKSVADKLFRVFVSPNFVKENPQFKKFVENLCLLDECELDQVTDEAARIAIEIHSYDGFIFVGGLLDIMFKQCLRLENLSRQRNA